MRFSTICLGTWAIAGSGWEFAWGAQDDEVSIATIRHAVERGINCIDTAAVYGFGHSEEVVGRALKGLAQKPYVATKCSRVRGKDGRVASDLSRESLRSELEASLRRLGVETIDFYQMHWPKPEEYIEEAWETIAGFVKEGKVRYAGVSNFSVEQMKRIQPIHPIASLQPPYSMFLRGIESDILPYCAANNIGVIVYSPMQKGLLSGRFTEERATNLAEDDHRKRDPMFQQPRLGINLQAVEKLRVIAERRGESVGRLAIDWVLRRSEVTSAIVGARSPQQVDENLSAPGIALSNEDVLEIECILADREESLRDI